MQLVTFLLERHEERSLEKFRQQLEHYHLLVLGVLGYVPFSKAGAGLFVRGYQSCQRADESDREDESTFEEWVEVLGSKRLIGVA
jgi:hypothetical protein